MFKGLTKAFKLELRYIKNNVFSLCLFLIIPIIIIGIYFIIGSSMVKWEPYVSLNLTFYDLYISGVIGLIILFFTTQMTVLKIVGERAPVGTLDRELIAISHTGMYFGKLFANMLIAFIQVILIYLSISFLFPAKNYGNPINIIIFLFLIAVFGLALGLFISIFSKSKELAVQIVPLFILIFLLFSGMMLPFEYMPDSIKKISTNLPLTLTYNAIEDLMLDGVGFEDVTSEFYILLIWIFGLILISNIKFSFERKR